MAAPSMLADVDWERWRGVVCTLVFAVRGSEVLLIRKKRGLGAGKINAPGGRLEAGETPLAGAIRETREEVCAVPRGLAWCGRNRFQFADGYATDVHVFSAREIEGTPAATAEADPFWVPIASADSTDHGSRRRSGTTAAGCESVNGMARFRHPALAFSATWRTRLTAHPRPRTLSYRWLRRARSPTSIGNAGRAWCAHSCSPCAEARCC